MTNEGDKILSHMEEQMDIIRDTVSDILDIAELPGNTLQVKDLLTRAVQIIEIQVINNKADISKIKGMVKIDNLSPGETEIMDILTSEEGSENADSKLSGESSKNMEQIFSFRPMSGKTTMTDKGIKMHNTIQMSYAEKQTMIMKELYNLSQTDIRYIDFSGIYPRINYLQGSNPQEIRYWYDFGAVNTIYLTAPEFPEISCLPNWVKTGIKDCYMHNPTMTPKDTLVLKIFSAGPDFCMEERYPAYHFMQLGKSESFSITVPMVTGTFKKFCANDIHYRRGIGIRVIIQTMEASFKRGFRTYGGDKIYSSVMISPARVTPRAASNYLEAKIKLLDKGIIKSSPQAQQKICQYRRHNKGTCTSCSPQKEIAEDKEVGVIIIPDDE